MRKLLTAFSAAALVAILAGPAVAQTYHPETDWHYDRVGMLPVVQHVCQNMIMADQQLVRSLLIQGIRAINICGCQADLFVSAATVQELEQVRVGRLEAATMTRFRKAIYICGIQALTTAH